MGNQIRLLQINHRKKLHSPGYLHQIFGDQVGANIKVVMKISFEGFEFIVLFLFVSIKNATQFTVIPRIINLQKLK